MLKINVFESNWFNSSTYEFDNVFDALQCAKALRAEDVEDRSVEIRCDIEQIIAISENLRKTDAVASGTYVDYNSLPEPEEAEDDYEEPALPSEVPFDMPEYMLMINGLPSCYKTRIEAINRLHEAKKNNEQCHVRSTPFHMESTKIALIDIDIATRSLKITRMPCCNSDGIVKDICGKEQHLNKQVITFGSVLNVENNTIYHEGLIEEAREWVDQWSREIGFDDVETDDTALYERKLEEYYVYLCKLKGVKPLDCYISK